MLAIITTSAHPPPPQISLSLYSGKEDPTAKEDGAYWTSFMESFEAAHGSPVATIKHVTEMSKLTEEVRTLLRLPIITSPCLTTPPSTTQCRTRPCAAPARCPSAST